MYVFSCTHAIIIIIIINELQSPRLAVTVMVASQSGSIMEDDSILAVACNLYFRSLCLVWCFIATLRMLLLKCGAAFYCLWFMPFIDCGKWTQRKVNSKNTITWSTRIHQSVRQCAGTYAGMTSNKLKRPKNQTKTAMLLHLAFIVIAIFFKKFEQFFVGQQSHEYTDNSDECGKGTENTVCHIRTYTVRT